MADRWSITIQGSGERTNGADTLEALLADFCNIKLVNRGFTVVTAKLSYTGLTVVVGEEAQP